MSYQDLRLRASFQGPREERKYFHLSRCQLTISVGQQSHEGDRFLAAIELINRSFSECIIMIDDSLQWYSLMIASPNKTKEEAIQEAIRLGDDWIERNEPFYSQLTIPYKVIRWNNWLNSSKLSLATQKMSVLYQSNPYIKNAIDQSAVEYLSRQNQNNGLFLSERAILLCTDYLIEECAVMSDFWVELDTHYEVYPCKRSSAMAATYELLIKPFYPNLLKSVWLRFNRRNTFKQCSSEKEVRDSDERETSDLT